MNERIVEGLTQCVERGKTVNQTVDALVYSMNVDRSMADRLVRTELSRVQNEARKNGYVNAGLTHYKFLSAQDERVCDDDDELDGQVFSFDEAEVGVNFPPMHPNCRCTIVPILSKEE